MDLIITSKYIKKVIYIDNKLIFIFQTDLQSKLCYLYDITS